MSDGPVMLGFIHGGWIRAEFLNSVLNAVSGPEASKTIGGVISSSAGPLVALARNNLASQFLDSDLEWLCSIDTDIVFSSDAVDRLFESADPITCPIMSALYYVFDNGKKVPAAYVNLHNDKLDLRPVPVFGPEINGPTEVMAVGCGFLLVHRSVFENIRAIENGSNCWYREAVIDGRDFGEDVSFCLRAFRAGFRVCVNTDVKVGHIKSAMLGEVN